MNKAKTETKDLAASTVDALVSRPITFRAWDEKIEKYHFWNAETETANDIFWQMVREEGMSPEQYSSMKDRNGNDLYEGDIVWACDNTFGKSEPTLWLLVFHQGTFVFVGEKGICRTTQLINIDLMGNWNENPSMWKKGG